MAKRTRKPATSRNPTSKDRPALVGLRIVGGAFRGRKLRYSGDIGVRPMKDRVREAVFNLLGPSIRGMYAIDLFGGTGALGLEAVSRGAVGATFIERHRPTAAVLRENIATCGIEPICRVIVGDTFALIRQEPRPSELPWVVFISPPYEFFVSRQEEMLGLIATLQRISPIGSVMAVETDQRFDFALLGPAEAWNVRDYSPARVGIYRKVNPETK